MQPDQDQRFQLYTKLNYVCQTCELSLAFLAIFFSVKKMYCRLEFGNETHCKNHLSSIVILSLDPCSGKNVPVCICVTDQNARRSLVQDGVHSIL